MLQLNSSFQINNSQLPSSIAPKKVQDKEKNKIALELGQIISATVTKKTDTKTMLATKDNYQFEADNDKITGQVGEELQFQVVKKTGDGIELKQITRESTDIAKAIEKKRSNVDLKEMFKKNNLITEDDPKAQDKDLKMKEMEAISKIKRQVRYVSNNMSRSALKELLASGVTLEKISLSVLNSVMKEIQSKPTSQVSPDELDKMINQYLEENNLPVKNTSKNKAIVKALSSEGLPPTDKNIKSLDTVVFKLKEIQSPDDETIAQLVKEEKSLTVENIYLAKHTSSSFQAKEKLPPETWKALDPEINKVFDREGIEKTDETVSAAKLLIENETPVTQPNVEKVIFLRNLKSHLNVQDILRGAAQNIKFDKSVSNVPVDTKSLPIQYENAIKDIPFITASHIEFILNKNQKPTIENLTQSLKEKLVVSEKIAVDTTKTEEVAIAKKQLVDIQLKLTYEAAQRMSSKKDNILNLPLAQAIAKLESLEQNADYSSSLRAMNADDSPENIAKINNLYKDLKDSQTQQNNLFAQLLSKAVPFTVRAIADNVRSNRLLKDYERFETVANPKHGDSFKKVEAQFSKFLEDMGITPTSENVKAASILSKSNLDVTDANLTEIKILDSKMSSIQNKLHPNIAAQMIKEGLNPREMKVDDVLNYIYEWDEKHGVSVSDNIYECIKNLDDTKTLTKDERESMIDFYRMLNIIQKDNNVSLGISLKYGSNLKLGDLMNDAKFYQKSKHGKADYNISVDDNFGALERPFDSNIRSRIESFPAKKLSEFEYNSLVIEKMAAEATPHAVTELFKTKTNNERPAKELLIEEAAEQLELANLDHKESISDERLEQAFKKITDTLNTPPTIINFMQRGQMPTTLSNIQAMQMLLKDSFTMGKSLDKLERDLKHEDDEFELELPSADLAELKLGNSTIDILDSVSAQLEDLKQNVTSRSLLEELELVQNSVQVGRHFEQHEENNRLQIPIKLTDKIANLNMYIVDENVSKKQTSDLIMSLNTDTIGNVSVFLKRDKDAVQLEISTDKVGASKLLKDNEASLVAYIRESGFHADSIVFTEKALVNDLPETVKNQVDYTPYQASEYEATI